MSIITGPEYVGKVESLYETGSSYMYDIAQIYKSDKPNQMWQDIYKGIRGALDDLQAVSPTFMVEMTELQIFLQKHTKILWLFWMR